MRYSLHDIITKIKQKHPRIKTKVGVAKLNTKSLKTFAEHGCNCVGCGAIGKYFRIDYFKNIPHMRLYAVTPTGREMLMTSDHIIPVSKGGNKSSLDNRQPMCNKCNALKGNFESLEHAKLARTPIKTSQLGSLAHSARKLSRQLNHAKQNKPEIVLHLQQKYDIILDRLNTKMNGK